MKKLTLLRKGSFVGFFLTFIFFLYANNSYAEVFLNSTQRTGANLTVTTYQCSTTNPNQYTVTQRINTQPSGQTSIQNCPSGQICAALSNGIECKADPAQSTNTTTPNAPSQNQQNINCPAYVGYTVTPCNVSESDFVVRLEFTSVPPLDDGTYYYCLKTDPGDCNDKDLKKANYQAGIDGAGTITFPQLCGDGDNKLKEKCRTDGRDWFHAGKTYRVTLFSSDDSNLSNVVGDAAFYITRTYPQVEIVTPASELTANNAKNGIELKVKMTGRNKKKGENDDKYNDYFLQVLGHDNGYTSPNGCIYVREFDETGEATLKLPYTSRASDGTTSKLTAGSYKLVVKDGTNGNFNGANASCKEGEFTYFHLPFLIGAGDNPGEIAEAIPDPYGKETGAKGVVPTPVPICPESDQDQNGYCTRIPTALGIYIHTDPRLFVRDMFTIVLSIGGLAAVLFFIQAGYKLMTSAGNKEKVADAREQITSAIMGILFIILSTVILEFIGVNILRLPGFGS